MAKIPPALPITAEQSRAARFQLGLTQAAVIKESDLPGYKLKQFETGRFVPDIPFLEGLRDYYIGKGIDLTVPETKDDQSVGKKSGQQTKGPGGSMIRPVSRMCFYVSDDVSQDVVYQTLERMDTNDERIAAILQSPVRGGLFSQFDEETEAKQRELFGAMAENYLLFRILQGRNIVTPPREGVAPATHAELLGTFFAASPLVAITGQTTDGKTKSANESDSEGGEK